MLILAAQGGAPGITEAQQKLLESRLAQNQLFNLPSSIQPKPSLSSVLSATAGGGKVDSDNDGLTDAEEALFGNDPCRSSFEPGWATRYSNPSTNGKIPVHPPQELTEQMYSRLR
jgi:hypothetical protein